MSRATLQDRSLTFGYQSAYQSAHMGQPQGPPGEARRPSRLLQMRDDYQRRMLKEKEERMVNMYEDNQRKNVERAERLTRGTAVNNAAAYPNSRLRQPGHMLPAPQQGPRGHQTAGQPPAAGPSVRDFFRERREMETKGVNVPQVNQHYRNRIGSGHSNHKHSAGVDRAQPLAPIQARHGGISSAPTRHPPMVPRPRFVKQNTNSPDIHDNASNHTLGQNTTAKMPSPPGRAAANRGRGGIASKADKLSDFQKWQMEQNKAREDRLKKLNMRAPPAGPESEDWGGNYEYEEEDEEVVEGGMDDKNEELQRQEQELLQRIARQQADLERLRKEREEAEELERVEAEMVRKEEALNRERRRRQQQEEARQRREEEALARREEEEQQRAARARHERQRYESVVDDYASQPNSHRSRGSSLQATPRYAPKPPGDATPRKPVQQRRQQVVRQRQPPTPKEDLDDIPVPGPGIDFYSSAVDEEAGTAKVRLVPCKVCGRKFADDRIQKHQGACKNANKKRRVFDPTEMRTDGTDMAKYVQRGAHKKEPAKKKKEDWRRKHKEFIANIRYAKQVQQMEQQGVSTRDLPPPPPSHNPDLVPCPHCGRTFNDQAAERHIPRCQGLKTRPAAGNRRR